MSRIAARRRRPSQAGQVLVLTLLVFMFVGVTMVAGTGDIAVAQREHERADEAATLAALSGAGQPAAASLYGGAATLADGGAGSAVQRCLAAVAATAPEAARPQNPADPGDPANTCRIVAGTHLRVTVRIMYSLPIPVPFVAPAVTSRREAVVIEGTVRSCGASCTAPAPMGGP